MESRNSSTVKPNTVIGGISEGTTIYLKRSELPKNVSSFTNDAGYVSSDTLADWLKKNAYISKNEIKGLIDKSNAAVIESINKSYDDESISKFEGIINDIKGEIIEIKDNLHTNYITVDSSETFAKKTELTGLASMNWVKNQHYVTPSDLSSSVSSLPTKQWVNEQNYISSSELDSKISGYATQEWVTSKGYITKHQNISGKADKSYVDAQIAAIRGQIPDIGNVATQEWVTSKGYITKHQNISGKADISYVDSQISRALENIPTIEGVATQEWVNGHNYATQEWVTSKGYITKHQNISGKADKSYVDNQISAVRSQIPSIDGLASESWVLDKSYVTESWLKTKGYLTKHQNISGKADISYVDSQIADVRSQIPSIDGLASESWVNTRGFLKKHQNISGKADISYVDSRISDIQSQIPSLSGYATQEWVTSKGYITKHQNISGKADKSYVDEQIGILAGLVDGMTPSFEGIATQNWVNEQNYATQEWVTSKKYLTQHQDISKKADISYVNEQIAAITGASPSFEGIATQDWVKSQGYITLSKFNDTLNKYALADKVYDKSYINSKYSTNSVLNDTFLKKDDAKMTYLKQTDAKNTYLTKTAAAERYLAIEDYRGLKAGAVINTDYKNKTIDELLYDMNERKFLNGFYMTNDVDENNNTVDVVAIVMDNELSLACGGNTLIWKEEQ